MATKIKALSLDVWDYVNPDMDEPELLLEFIPADATRRIILPEGESESTTAALSREQIGEEHLTAIERDRLHRLRKQYDVTKKHLRDFLGYLSSTVATHYMNEAVRGNNTNEMMVILKTHYLSPRMSVSGSYELN